MARNKKALAELAYRLYGNIDEANQGLDHKELFKHLDNSYLLYLIKDFRDSVVENMRYGDFLLHSEEGLEKMLEEARKALGEPKENDEY